MAVIRRMFYPEHEIIPCRSVHGEPIFVECECGGMVDPKTGRHAVTESFDELVKRLGLPKKAECDKPTRTEGVE